MAIVVPGTNARGFTLVAIMLRKWRKRQDEAPRNGLAIESKTTSAIAPPPNAKLPPMICMLGGVLALAQAGPNLVPRQVSTAPDYFCTWNIQGYACNYTGAAPTRALINEASLLGHGPQQGWLDFFPSIRGDLLFVMDDSWDVPPSGDERALGRLQLDEAKFPSFTGDAVTRMSKLTKAVKAKGWRGLGGWVCAQECPLLPAQPSKEYWADRLAELSKGGMNYLKVDWGEHDRDTAWRRTLAKLRPKSMTVEAALAADSVAFADVYRTYDVEAVISAPSTLHRISELFAMPAAQKSPTLVNCEDEVVLGAGLGCAYGVMRHPLAGSLPDGRQDFVFPPTCRDLKRRMDEVVRAVRWHRIAPPFPMGKSSFVRSPKTLTDRWTMKAGESWVERAPGSVASAEAPAIMARGMALPTVRCSEAEPPFVVAARYPNGCVSVATVGRALDRTYRTPLADVQIKGATFGRPIGVFGHYRSLSIVFPGPVKPKSIWAQDLAANRSVDIRKSVQIRGNVLTLPGSLIDRVGLSAAHPGDPSDPGLVLVVNSR